MKFLNLIDFGNFISKKIYYTLIEKNICSVMENFEQFAQRRMKNYESEIVIEGHFHQGKEFSSKNRKYINIPSLVCSKKYTILDDDFKGVNL